MSEENLTKIRRLYSISPESEEAVKATYEEFWPKIQEEIDKAKKMRENTKFPDPTEYDPSIYRVWQIQDWIKRCIQSAPVPEFKDIKEHNMIYRVKNSHLSEAWEEWFNKWFSPFKEIKND